MTNIDSFKRVKTWVVELGKYLEPNTPIVIAGNKKDLVNKVVSLSEAQDYAKSIGVDHILTSAFEPESTRELFMTLAKQIVERQDASELVKTPSFNLD